ncbi:transcriptional regulator [Rhizobium sp. AC44/96]|uniref:helix-turn-helix domain-containing protein n=1 Tax=Rhizobium sp. AC44/96 TaxID=1841654 RepID=UPI00080F85D8|nr:helix-turn-helix domain-containing protein [Rhizobium sp. AC44/96]OCJ11476.1 transcriptional regulator [Rhizobium sp. AC44/96]
MVEKKKPNDIDVNVGQRIRLRRQILGMSQTTLGDALGITFQQVQKYEKGTNRVGASRLSHIASILSVPVSHFFEGMPTAEGSDRPDSVQHAPENLVTSFLSTSEGLALNRAFTKIVDPGIRKKIVGLVKALAAEDGSEPEAA